MRKSKRKSNTPAEAGKLDTGMIWVGLFICLHLVLAGIYWKSTTFGYAPDERPHARYVEVLADTHRLPILRHMDPLLYETHQPPLYYVLGIPFLLLGRSMGLDDPGIMIRLLSVILGAFSIWFTYRVLVVGLPHRKDAAIGAAGFLALLPTHVMIASSVNNDTLTELVFALGLLACTLIITDGVTRRRTIALGVVLGLGLLVKTTCALLFPIAVTAFFVLWRKEKASRTVLAHAAAAIGIGLLLGGWWMVRNKLVYDDFFAMKMFATVFQDVPTPEKLLSEGWTVKLYLADFLFTSFLSFWGVFGHMVIFMPKWVYQVLLVPTAGAFIGSLAAVWTLRKQRPESNGILALYGVTLALTVLAFVQFNMSFVQPQARYLCPAFVPISLMFSLGLTQLFPSRIRRFGLALPMAVVSFAQVAALVTSVLSRMPYLYRD